MTLQLPVALLACSLALTGCEARHTPSAIKGAATSTASASPPSKEVHPVKWPGRSATQLTLRCAVRPSVTPLEVSYTVTNGASEDAYLLDLSASPRPDRSGIDVELRPIYLSWLGGTSAHLGQGIAPLPPDRDVYARSIPLTTRLGPGASLVRTITLPEPLAELGPYDRPALAGPDDPSIDRLVITLSALRPSMTGFTRDEVPGHAGVFRVATKSTVLDVERARCEIALPRTKLRVFRWDDARGPTFERAE